jgi:hypothetical protein
MFEPSSVQNIVVILIQPMTVALCAGLVELKRQRRRVRVFQASARGLPFPGGASLVC